MDKREEMKPNDVPQWAWDEALNVFDAYLYAGDSAQEIIARALSQARSQAYEECAVLAYIECAKTRHLKLGEDVAQAIRQHSQKGGENA